MMGPRFESEFGHIFLGYFWYFWAAIAGIAGDWLEVEVHPISFERRVAGLADPCRDSRCIGGANNARPSGRRLFAQLTKTRCVGGASNGG